MAVKTTCWSPDTCDCRIEYNWDDEVAAHLRVHTIGKVDIKCAVHQAVADNDLLDTLLNENRRKNVAFGIIKGFNPDFQLKDFGWFFDEKRVLQVTIAKGLTTEEKSELQDACDIQFGMDKAVMADG